MNQSAINNQPKDFMDQIPLDDFQSAQSDEVSVEKIETYCKIIADLKTQEESIEDKLKELKAESDRYKTELIEMLDKVGKKKYSSNVGTFSVVTKFSVQTPKTPEDKEAFFSWLEQKGIKDSVLNIHSATLNKLYNEELEASNDPSFKIPGIQEPTHYKYLQLRR